MASTDVFLVADVITMGQLMVTMASAPATAAPAACVGADPGGPGRVGGSVLVHHPARRLRRLCPLLPEGPRLRPGHCSSGGSRCGATGHQRSSLPAAMHTSSQQLADGHVHGLACIGTPLCGLLQTLVLAACGGVLCLNCHVHTTLELTRTLTDLQVFAW
jgi:hypothetical protein